MDDAEKDFDLVKPRAVFGQVDEADAVCVAKLIDVKSAIPEQLR